MNGYSKIQNNVFHIRPKHCLHKPQHLIHKISNITRYWMIPLKIMVRLYNYNQRNVKVLEEPKEIHDQRGRLKDVEQKHQRIVKARKKRKKDQTKHKGSKDERIGRSPLNDGLYKVGTHWMQYGGEATVERPGLEGNGLPRKISFFGYIKPSKMIRSCLRGIGPGGCVLPRWEVFNHFAFVVLTNRSDGELLYEMTAYYRLMRCLGSTWNSQHILQHDAILMALSATVFSRKCMRTHVVYLLIEIGLVGEGRGFVVNGFQPRYSSNNWWPTYLSTATEGQLWLDRRGGANSVYRLYAEGRARRRTLEALLDDAKEQADQDGMELSDTQLRNDE